MPNLTEGQQRHLEVVFRSLLREAREIRARVLPLCREGADPSTPWARPVVADLDELVEDVQRAAAALGLSLEPRPIPPHREVTAWASTAWASVMDCRPAALRGYGPVDEGLETTLGPAVEHIAARLLHIVRTAETARRKA